jgi:hypothetical protein
MNTRVGNPHLKTATFAEIDTDLSLDAKSLIMGFSRTGHWIGRARDMRFYQKPCAIHHCHYHKSLNPSHLALVVDVLVQLFMAIYCPEIEQFPLTRVEIEPHDQTRKTQLTVDSVGLHSALTELFARLYRDELTVVSLHFDAGGNIRAIGHKFVNPITQPTPTL